MSFTTLQYFIFLTVGVLAYYLIPKSKQWCMLLLLSYVYYCSFTPKTVGFLVFTTISVYIGGRLLGNANDLSKAYLAEHKQEMSKEEKKAYKERTKKTKRLIVVCMLLLNFGMLGAVKYLNFIITNIDAFVLAIGHGQYIEPTTILLPIGISFYTFQSISYIIDVYQGKYAPEKNVFKFALFVAFFPQLLQGPIGRYDRLAPQLYAGRKFDLKTVEFGVQRIFWGLFKKMVLADRAAVLVTQVCADYQNYGGFYNIMAVLMYSVQLYADFSGGIDVVIGTAQLFGITMDENFRQPYFSKSIGEFWRRWHITLGTWMKDYIFYPFSLSKAMNKFGKWGKKHMGTYLGKTLPVCLANLLIFFIVGIWHGAAWKYIAYGMYNGVIIAVSNLLEPVYHKGLAACHIASDSKGWTAFKIFRTFVLVNIGWYFDIAPNFKVAMTMMVQSVTKLNMHQLTDGSMMRLGLEAFDYAVILFGCVIILVVSILKERGIAIRESVAAKPLVVRWCAYYALIAMILFLGYIGATQGFIYAQF